ncbi:MAG: type II secretion system protein GspM [Caulobacter sp.]
MSAAERLRTWWFERSGRERWMLAGLGLVLALLLIWYGMLTPLRWAAGEAADRRARAVAGLAMTQDMVRESAGRRPGPARSLAEVVDLTAAATGVEINRRRQDADGRLTIWIDAVDPKTLMQWIVILRRAHGVAVTALTATKADAANLEVEIAFVGTRQ